MGIFRDIAGAAIGAATGGASGAAGAAAASGGGKKRKAQPGETPGQESLDRAAEGDVGSDGGFGSYMKRTGKIFARRALQKRDM